MPLVQHAPDSGRQAATTRIVFLMIRRPPRSTRKESSAASDVYKRQEKHEKLPSYCYWDCYSIEKETYQESYKWWNNIDTNQHKELKAKWVKCYKIKV